LPKIIAISALSENRVIGKNGALPWHVPQEYAHFLKSVKGQVMIMGRKSWEVFGGDVCSLANIVISRSNQVDRADHVANDLLSALEIARQYQAHVFVAGGGQIYKEALLLDCLDEMWLSTIPIHIDDGDVFFPEFDQNQWTFETRFAEGYFLNIYRKIKI
jgi:dihydrofolate reductase